MVITQTAICFLESSLWVLQIGTSSLALKDLCLLLTWLLETVGRGSCWFHCTWEKLWAPQFGFPTEETSMCFHVKMCGPHSKAVLIKYSFLVILLALYILPSGTRIQSYHLRLFLGKNSMVLIYLFIEEILHISYVPGTVLDRYCLADALQKQIQRLA